MHKAYNGILPTSLINGIAKKHDLSYSIRARDSLLVPRFNTRFMKDSAHTEALSFGTCCLLNTLTLPTQSFLNRCTS